MGNFSKPPSEVLTANQDKGYVGLWIEQGVPVLDRDLNLMHDLIAAAVRSLAARYIGDGIAAGTDGFAILALPDGQNTNDFGISAGTCLVGGVEVTNHADTAYSAQSHVPPLTEYEGHWQVWRIDIVYLDVFLLEVDDTVDTDLKNSQDVGMQTSTRLKAAWVVRVAEGVEFRLDRNHFMEGQPVPAAPPGHTFFQLAELHRNEFARGGAGGIAVAQITDLRQRRLTLTDLERRLSPLEIPDLGHRLSRLESLLPQPRFVNPPLPEFEPVTGAINQNITLNGTNFDIGTVRVQFDNIDATIVDRPMPTQIVVQVPRGLTPDEVTKHIKIKVTTSGGSVTSNQTFAVLPNPAFAPIGSQISLTSAHYFYEVTLHGHNFRTVREVLFGGVIAPLISFTTTQIVAVVPRDVWGSVKITVRTGYGQTTSDDLFATPALRLVNYYDKFLNANQQLEIVDGTLHSGQDIKLLITDALQTRLKGYIEVSIMHFVRLDDGINTGWSPLQSAMGEQSFRLSSLGTPNVTVRQEVNVKVKGAQVTVGQTGVIAVIAKITAVNGDPPPFGDENITLLIKFLVVPYVP